MRELIERLEKATGPDRDLDEAILKSFGIHSWAGRMSYQDGPLWIDFGSSEITASIDAAVALTERVLPDVGWSVATNRIDRRRVARLWTGEIDDGKAHAGASPAIALCLAILRAKEDSA